MTAGNSNFFASRQLAAGNQVKADCTEILRREPTTPQGARLPAQLRLLDLGGTVALAFIGRRFLRSGAPQQPSHR